MGAHGDRRASAKALKYRPEIDGLRAIAVASVILFHAGFSGFGGGYVGVDIFFVISGYLITTIIAGELEAGRFSIAAFYERRARRILPALVFVVLATWPFAWALMLPAERAAYSETIATVALFVSNILFGQQFDYFAPSEAEQPLLHTWSLSVEEQFYVLFPLMLLLAWRMGQRGPLFAVMALATVSLALAEYGWRTDPDTNFFFTGSRAWELMIGALCAFAERHWGTRASGLLAAAGMAMMGLAILLYTSATPMPSVYTALPVLGAALVILFARESGPVARLLSLRPVVALGLVSYSAYLWHQPLFALARVRSIGAPPEWLMAALVVLTLALAWASWRYVETPFRRRSVPALPRRSQVFSWSALSLVGLLALGVGGLATDGGNTCWMRANPEMARTYELLQAALQAHREPEDAGPCRFNLKALDANAVARIEDCAARHGPGVAVLGDSHGIDVFSALQTLARRDFVMGLAIGGCPLSEPELRCKYDEFAELAERRSDLFSLVIYAQSGSYLLLSEEGAVGSRQIFLRSAWDVPLPRFEPDQQRIARAADYLGELARRVPVVWLAPRIEPHVSPNLLLRHGCDHGYDLRPNQRDAFERLDRAIEATVAERAPNVTYAALGRFPPLDMGHDFMTCDVLYWSDGDHWSPEGEALFGSRIIAAGLPGMDGF